MYLVTHLIMFACQVIIIAQAFRKKEMPVCDNVKTCGDKKPVIIGEENPLFHTTFGT